MLGFAVFFSLLLVGCGDKRRAHDSSANTAPTKAAAAARPPEITEGMGVRLTGEAEHSVIQIRVANAGTSVVRLSSALSVEHLENGEWSEVDGIASLTLRPDCQTQAPECVSLVTGAELFPPAWLGTRGDAQCDCTRCGHVESGSYRFVAHSCDGDRVYRGTPFLVTH